MEHTLCVIGSVFAVFMIIVGFATLYFMRTQTKVEVDELELMSKKHDR